MLNFKTKQRTRTTAAKEVTIRLNASGALTNGERRYCVAFRFYKGAEKKVCTDGLYMTYADDNENCRIYFKETDAINGWKITDTNRGSVTTSKTVTVVAYNEDLKHWGSLVGDYDLLFDQREKLYYVDYSKKAR